MNDAQTVAHLLDKTADLIKLLAVMFSLFCASVSIIGFLVWYFLKGMKCDIIDLTRCIQETLHNPTTGVVPRLVRIETEHALRHGDFAHARVGDPGVRPHRRAGEDPDGD